MDKIVVIGAPGAGKTTLAKDLSSILNIKIYHLDRFFWQRGWKGKAGDVRVDILQKLVVRDTQWIMEGTYIDSSTPRMEAADTIIFLNLSPLLCLIRIIIRHYMSHNCPRRDLPEGCTDRLSWSRILKVLLFPFRERKRLEKVLRKYEAHESKHIIRLNSRKKVEFFLERERQKVNKQKSSAEMKEKSPAAVR